MLGNYLPYLSDKQNFLLLSYTEVANNINNQETIINIQMIQIDCTLFKVSLVQICHEWQQSLIQIVLNRLENDLQMIVNIN